MRTIVYEIFNTACFWLKDKEILLQKKHFFQLKQVLILKAQYIRQGLCKTLPHHCIVCVCVVFWSPACVCGAQCVCVCVGPSVCVCGAQWVGRPDGEKVPAGVLTLTTGQRHWSVAQAQPLIGQDTTGQRQRGLSLVRTLLVRGFLASHWWGHQWSLGEVSWVGLLDRRPLAKVQLSLHLLSDALQNFPTYGQI